MSERTAARLSARVFPGYGWLGMGLIAVFWTLNWSLPGVRTHWIFFPLWLGYCLTIDGLVFLRRGTSLFTRSRRKYLGLFLVSAPVWWLFELFNARLDNWHYQGAELFHPLVYALWATLSFTTVIPAVFGSAELFSSFAFVQRLRRGPVVRPDRQTTLVFFISGAVMLAAMLALPKIFFPFLWISIYFITEPINIWLGNRNLGSNIQNSDWRPVIALWLGVLLTAFFWEMWNYLAYPRWVYTVPWGDFWHVFEMPLLGYGGYLPFALELYAIYHLITGLLGDKNRPYLQLAGQTDGD